ncbi:DUF2848 family protein [Maledivibacter halophilus]|uniref:DUF2848 domain-containing protein n=1 Tax=Maledivibacter halophilus TaxID=36842 RepID=A0A1T5MDD6_9FIRM|nr:DUF2848 family protein [Maledivibacter halophilus]SKC86261.1 Protein of unknown function [Maledivibacter halophilus]
MKTLNFNLVTKSGNENLEFKFNKVLAIGFAGRDQKKVMEHIHELEEIGVAPPESIPTLYPCADELVTQEGYIQVLGGETSGEVEFVILIQDNKIYIGLGSDHTDRGLEAVSIPKSKQICLKPIAKEIWLYDEIKDHWDDLILRSWQKLDDNEEKLYQDGKISEILKVEDIITEVKKAYPNLNNIIMFSGTVPVLNGFVYGTNFRCELEDKHLGRKISHEYVVEVLK